MIANSQRKVLMKISVVLVIVYYTWSTTAQSVPQPRLTCPGNGAYKPQTGPDKIACGYCDYFICVFYPHLNRWIVQSFNCTQGEFSEQERRCIVRRTTTTTTSEPTTEGTGETTPENTSESTSGNTETTPENTETTPENTETTPENTETTPENTETTPENTETTPENTETTPESTSKTTTETTT